jgi:hypothetical protein
VALLYQKKFQYQLQQYSLIHLQKASGTTEIEKTEEKKTDDDDCK